MTKVLKFVGNVKRKIRSSAVSAQAVLCGHTGASAVEIAGAAVMAIVLICVLLQAFTGIFSDSIIPGIKDKVSQMFAIAG